MEKMLEVRQLGKSYERRNGKAPADRTSGLGAVSFHLEKGDVLGMVGRNGAGKSTLLKILAGIIPPTTGTATYKGKLVSILEFGTGFHPDLTGEENVYMNASLMGMRQAETRERFQAILDFSELGDYIHEPVKNYSNGMYLRLAFSVFTHLRCDILLLDEVISTGDFSFRQKCYDRIRQLAAAGTTIVMVSHQPDQIRHLCNKYMWLDKGGIVAFGDEPAILENYLKACVMGFPAAEGEAPTVRDFCLYWQPGFNIKNELRLLRFGLRGKNKRWEDPVLQCDDLEIEIEFEKVDDREQIEIGISILSQFEAWVLADSQGIYYRFHDKVLDRGIYLCRYVVPAGILNFGRYQLGLMISRCQQLIYQHPYMVNFEIPFQEQEGLRNHLAKNMNSIVRPTGNWAIERL
jgi:ABC-type polysaccharide/polyol phosphate transport system ATPase subunit